MNAKRELRGKIKGEFRFFVNVALAKFKDQLVRERKISPENACTESIHLEYEAAEAILAKLSELGFVRIENGLSCPRCGKVFHDEDVKKSPNDYWTCPTCSTIQHKKCRGVIGEVYVRLEDVAIDEGELCNMLSCHIVDNNIHIKTMGGKEKEVPLDIIIKLAKAIASAKPIRVKEGK